VCPAASAANPRHQLTIPRGELHRFPYNIEALQERCGDATYEEVVSGLMQHVRLLNPVTNTDDTTTNRNSNNSNNNKRDPKMFCASSTPPSSGEYAAIHVRVSKESIEYVDLRDEQAVNSLAFWSELLRQIGLAGYQHVCVASSESQDSSRLRRLIQPLTLPPPAHRV
jgi:hypothetical protein